MLADQTFAYSVLKKDDAVETAVRASYKTKTYGYSAAFSAAGKVCDP